MANVTTIKNPGNFQISGTLRGVLLAFAALGVATFFLGLKMDPDRMWASFVLDHFFFLSLALGGAFFAAVQWLTGSMWSAPVRRLSEAFTAYLPVGLITFLLLYFGMHHIYLWTNPARVSGDLMLEHKVGYLNIPFFMIRNVVAIGIWIFFARKLVKNSLAQDASGDLAYTKKNRVWAPVFLVVFALTYTMVSFDQLMSLDPHWYSTIFGVYTFSGLFYAVLAALCLVTLYLLDQGKLQGIVNDNHLHDLGKFMFAFTVFWAYIAFSQFLLIWYANLPEETRYFLHRFHDGWAAVSLFLIVGKFMVPFFVLLPRDAKRNKRVLTFVAVFMLVAQWIDTMWMVQPEFFTTGPRFGFIEIGMLLGFMGLFGLVVSRFLGKHNIVAIGDPRLAESVFHHHQ